MKISDVDLSKQAIQMQDFAQQVRAVVNNGGYEINIAYVAPPATTAPQEPLAYLSIVGTQYRFYVSYLGDWFYVALTKE